MAEEAMPAATTAALKNCANLFIWLFCLISFDFNSYVTVTMALPPAPINNGG
jgi:hypothetical protein